jgi:hypothetical protein
LLDKLAAMDGVHWFTAQKEVLHESRAHARRWFAKSNVGHKPTF